MKKLISVLAVVMPLALVVGALGMWFVSSGSARASTCQATTFSQNGSNNLTAALIVSASNQTVTGAVNAAGCNIGIYVNHGVSGVVISGVQVFGANFDGIVNDGGNVKVMNSFIHDIGFNPLNGDQQGYGIYFTANSSKGSITGNMIWNYQKNGIVVRGVGSRATISHNTVIGQGPVTYIAQNGIELGEGAKGSITNNIVTGNSYSGSNNAASGGVLLYGGSCYGTALTIGIKVTGNVLIGNDVGVYLSNLDGTDCIPTLTPTNIVASNNIITNDGVNNITGYSPTAGYQAGISDQGDGDQLTNNSICGLGYTAVTPPPYLYLIDVTNTNGAVVSGNTSCLDGSSVSALLAAAKGVHADRLVHTSI